jgi:hypothetical protein
MTTYLFDKLAILKETEAKNKEEQKIILEEMEFEIEKQRRLEMDGTIIKLRTQVDEFAENIGGEIMPNNLELFYYNIEKHVAGECKELSACRGKIGEDEFNKRNDVLRKKHMVMRNDARQFRPARYEERKKERFITLDKFIDNLKYTTEETNAVFATNQTHTKHKNEQFKIPLEIKIYADLKPIFTTMIGIMNKQKDEIQKLREQFRLKI